MNNLGVILEQLRRRREAARYYRRAIGLHEKLTQTIAPGVELSGRPGPALPQPGQRARRGARGRGGGEGLSPGPSSCTPGLVRDFPHVPRYRDQLGRHHSALVSLLQKAGRLEDAEAELRRTRERLGPAGDDWPKEHDYLVQLSSTQARLGRAHEKRRQFAPAAQAHRQALAGYEKLAGELPREASYQAHLAAQSHAMARLHADVVPRAEARRLCRRALRCTRSSRRRARALPAYRAARAAVYKTLAAWSRAPTGPAEAERAHRRAGNRGKTGRRLPEERRSTTATWGRRLNNLAMARLEAGDRLGARQLVRRACCANQQLAADEPPRSRGRARLPGQPLPHPGAGRTPAPRRRPRPTRHSPRGIAVRGAAAGRLPDDAGNQEGLAELHGSGASSRKAPARRARGREVLTRKRAGCRRSWWPTTRGWAGTPELAGGDVQRPGRFVTRPRKKRRRRRRRTVGGGRWGGLARAAGGRLPERAVLRGEPGRGVIATRAT